jgi:hypothetical protein
VYVHHITSIPERRVTLFCNIALPSDSSAVYDVFWTKGDRKIDISGSGGKYSGGSIAHPSLSITEVNSDDIGIYHCYASNSAGSMCSNTIQLGK